MDQKQQWLALLAADKQRVEAAAEMQCRAFRACAFGEGTMERYPILLSGPAPQAETCPLDVIHFDEENMLFNGLHAAVTALAGGREAVPSVRANMGCGIVAALFGVEPMLFPDKMPWIQKHLDRDTLENMTAADIRVTPEFAMALKHMDHAAANLAGGGCYVFPVDIQGPFDTAHLLMGDDIFYELYDDPDYVHHVMELATAATVMAYELCLEHMPHSDKFVCHYNSLAMPAERGCIKLSEDTTTLLNAAQMEEFALPYTHRILEHFGGGYIHYCGKNPALYAAVMADPLVYAINFGNPDMHDMEQVLRDCAAGSKLYYGLIPQNEGESRKDYFARLIRAARGERGLHLLLQYAADDPSAVARDWDEACGEVTV